MFSVFHGKRGIDNFLMEVSWEQLHKFLSIPVSTLVCENSNCFRVRLVASTKSSLFLY
ncbi:hypothetical protein LguiB_006405 [Lonicera macranthoides]